MQGNKKHYFLQRYSFIISILLCLFLFGTSTLSAQDKPKGKSSNKPFNHKKRNKGTKQDAEKNKTGKKKKIKKSKTARKEKKGSNKPFNHKSRNNATKQDSEKNKVGKKTKLKQAKTARNEQKGSNKPFNYKQKSRGSGQDTERNKSGTTKHSKRIKIGQKPSTKQDDFSPKSSDRTKKPRLAHDKFSPTTTNRQKQPSTNQNKHGVGMVDRPRSEKNKQPIDLTKTTVKVPVVNYRKTDLHRIRHQEKLKIALVPPKKNKAPLEKTYMVKLPRTHKKPGMPNRNPVEWSLKRSLSKDHKNPRPEISKYHGDFKRPTRLYQEFLNWKKSRELRNDFGKLNIVRPANNRKEYRKLSRKVSSWQGDIKVLRRYKHEHPSLRFQVYNRKPKGADVRRNNKKSKKAKYDPNERKIWEPKDEYSTY